METLKKKEHCVTSGGFGLDCVYGNGWCHFFFLGTHIHLFQLHRTFQKEPHEDLRAPDMRMTQLLTRAWGRRAKGSLQASVDPSSCSTRSIYMADPIPNSIHHLVCNTQVCGWRLPHPHCSSTCIGCWVHPSLLSKLAEVSRCQVAATDDTATLLPRKPTKQKTNMR